MTVRELIEQLSSFPENYPVHFVNEDATSYPGLQRAEVYGRMVLLDCHLIWPREPEVITAFDGKQYIVDPARRERWRVYKAEESK